MRIETGALQIGDDWTGLFIRGDDAFMLRNLLMKAYRNVKLGWSDEDKVLEYIAMIDCDVSHRSEDREVQKIKILEEPA